MHKIKYSPEYMDIKKQLRNRYIREYRQNAKKKKAKHTVIIINEIRTLYFD